MRLRGKAFAVLAVALAAGCSNDSPDDELPRAPESLTVTSVAFEDGAEIPTKYTCDGDNLSPPLDWSGVPAEAEAVALVVDDPDAPGGTYTHWVVLDIPVDTASATEGSPPTGGVQAQNSAGETGYRGPCPPEGTHHYRFKIVALEQATGLAEGATLEEALAAIAEVTVARGQLTASYSRHD